MAIDFPGAFIVVASGVGAVVKPPVDFCADATAS